MFKPNYNSNKLPSNKRFSTYSVERIFQIQIIIDNLFGLGHQSGRKTIVSLLNNGNNGRSTIIHTLFLFSNGL